MRLDVDIEGHWLDARNQNYSVLVDGVRSDLAVMADDEMGCVEEYVQDEDGRLIPDISLPRKFKTRMRWGKVQFVPYEGGVSWQP